MTEYTHRFQACERISGHPKRAALAFFVVWGIGDLLSTIAMTQAIGPWFEANPVMRFFLSQGAIDFAIVKFVGSGLVTAGIYYWRDGLWQNSYWVPIYEVMLIWGVLVVIANTLASVGVGV